MLAETTRVGSIYNIRFGQSSIKRISSRQLRKRVPIAIAAFSVMATKGASSAAAAAMVGHSPSTRFDYKPPSWAETAFANVPPFGRLQIANLPTPLYQWTSTPRNDNKRSTSTLLRKLKDLDITMYIKRDDMSGGTETGGNKIRKLEFLLADALARDYKGVVTIGGEQSNHCRATAAAARMVGLEPHLILRTRRADAIQTRNDEDIGYVGNILFGRMVGSSIYTCTPGEYGRVGSQQLVARVCAHLEEKTPGSSDGADPSCYYPIPVGGSNGIGTWGYVNGVDELLSQWNSIDTQPPSLDHVVFACGSGGTAAGIALGMALAHGALDDDTSSTTTGPPQVHAIGVCDNPDYFYGHVAKIADEMGLKLPEGTSTESFVRQHMIAHHGKGRGYAVSTPEELDFIADVAMETGVVLDPVYSGKALYHFVTKVLDGEDAEQYRGKNMLFWHTGTYY
jgi:D-cysteine desulfhydrase family pyridoxal phosphate-dependent enzyme